MTNDGRDRDAQLSERESEPLGAEGLEDLYAVAAEWHSQLNDRRAGALERAQLDMWLSEDPRHAAAYRAILRMWDATRTIATQPEILRLRQEALATVAPLQRERFAAKARFLGTAAVVALVGVGMLALSVLREKSGMGADAAVAERYSAGLFSTTVGERSTIALSDGSTIVLDTRSQVDIRFSSKERYIELRSGQAWFQVAKDALRPFVVEAGSQRVTALGTEFDVRLGGHAQSVQVTLAEGKVAVEAIQSPLARLVRSAPAVALLTPGESLLVTDSRPIVRRHADVAKIASWRSGLIMFDDDSLESAVDEMNRYSNTQIKLADPSLSSLRVSGVFKAGHSRSFIETVTGHYAITASEQSDGRVLLVPKPSGP